MLLNIQQNLYKYSLLISSPLSTETIGRVLVPSAILIAGTFFVKQEWVPYAVAVAAVFSAFRILTARTVSLTLLVLTYRRDCD